MCERNAAAVANQEPEAHVELPLEPPELHVKLPFEPPHIEILPCLSELHVELPLVYADSLVYQQCADHLATFLKCSMTRVSFNLMLKTINKYSPSVPNELNEFIDAGIYLFSL